MGKLGSRRGAAVDDLDDVYCSTELALTCTLTSARKCLIFRSLFATLYKGVS